MRTRFNRNAFRTWLLLKRLQQPITARRVLERLEYARRHGFQLERFLRAPKAAQREGDAYLVRRLEEGSLHAFNNDVQWLMALAAWRGHRDVKFRRRPDPPVQFRALDRAQIQRVTGYRHRNPVVNRFRRALLLVFLETGARLSEVARLELQDLDPVRSLIHIRQPAKRGRRRWIPVSRWIWSPKRPLGAYLSQRPGTSTTSTTTGAREALWMVDWSGSGHVRPRPASPDYLRRVLFHVSADLGFTVNGNVFRHTKATELRRRGFDILVIKFILGHASIESTQVYAELTPQDVYTLFRRRPTPDYYQEADD